MATLPSSTAQTALTEEESLKLFEGIVLGRTLHQLEKALGIKAERLLSLVRSDERAFLDFKEAREFSAYVLEDDVSEKLRKNADSPESAVKNNALKIWADHIHWVAERRNAAVYSGKAPVSLTVPIQINTSLDLGQVKALEGVYALEATTTQEVPAADIDTSALDPVEIERQNPFSGAASAQFSPQAGQKGRAKASKSQKTGPKSTGRYNRVVQKQPAQVSRLKSSQAGKVSGAASRASGHGKREKPARNERKAEKAT